MSLKRASYKEFRGEEPNGLSIHEKLSDEYQPVKDKIIKYLKTKNVMSASGLNYDYFDQAKRLENLHSLTDGVWIWRSDLAYYIEQYNCSLPREFIDHMAKNEWITPNLNKEDIIRLIPFSY